MTRQNTLLTPLFLGCPRTCATCSLIIEHWRKEMFSPEEKYQIRMDELCQDSSKALFLKFSVHLQFF